MGLYAAGEERQVFRLTLLSAVLNLGLNAVLIPRFGAPGAAVATLSTEALRAALAVQAVRRLHLVPPGLGRFAKALAAAGVMGAVVVGLGGWSVWLLVPLGAVAYGATLWAVGGVRLRGGTGPARTV